MGSNLSSNARRRSIVKSSNKVASAVEFLVVRKLFTPGANWRNDGLDAVIREAFADAVGIIAFIENGCLKDVVGIQTLLESLKLSTVMGVPGAHIESDTAIFIDGGSVDLGAQSPTRASQSLIGAFFLQVCRPCTARDAG